MTKLLIIFAVALFLANKSEKYTRAVVASGHTYHAGRDRAFILLVVALSLFTGLRTSYNDSPLSSKRQKNICTARHLAIGAIF